MYFSGDRLRSVRERRGYDSKVVAENIGVTPSGYSKYENGISFPSESVLGKMALFLNVSTDYLMGFDDNDILSKAERNNLITSNLNDVTNVPILSYVRAGESCYSSEDIEGYFPVPRSEINGYECFFLRVRGDSMKNARIEDGDYVFVRKQSDVESGDIAIVFTDFDESTIKRVIKKGGKIILRPENPNYKEKEYDSVRFAGKVLWAKIDL